MTQPLANKNPDSGPSRYLISYIVVTPLLATAALVYFISCLPVTIVESIALSPDQLSEEHLTTFLITVFVMIASGALGGCASNLRRIIKHSDPAHYDKRFELSYYIRPINGAIAGVFVFFLLLGGALSLSGNNDHPLQWDSLTGVAPYVTVALLAGYSAREFGHKLHELADHLFSTKMDSKDRPGPQEYTK